MYFWDADVPIDNRPLQEVILSLCVPNKSNIRVFISVITCLPWVWFARSPSDQLPSVPTITSYNTKLCTY